MQEPVEIARGIHVVEVGLGPKLAPVNVYLLRCERGRITLFDTAIATVTDDQWRSTLGAIGATPSDVEQIVVSHHHPDHIGGTGRVHRLTGAAVRATSSTIEKAPLVWGDEGRVERYVASMRAYLVGHGVPEPILAMLDREPEVIRRVVDLAPPAAWTTLADGDRLEIGERSWRVITTPGHADGHLVLLDEQEGILLAGDHLLERISPAVGRYPGHVSDPLARYLGSLQRIEREPVRLVLPGHGGTFVQARERARELQHHHDLRLTEMVETVRASGGSNAYDVARASFPSVFADTEPPDATSQRFATTETVAHLDLACARGLLMLDRAEGGALRYRAHSS